MFTKDKTVTGYNADHAEHTAYVFYELKGTLSPFWEGKIGTFASLARKRKPNQRVPVSKGRAQYEGAGTF